MLSIEQLQSMVLERLKTVVQKAVDAALEARLDEIREILAQEKKDDAKG